MTTFSYSTGDPTQLTESATADVTDIPGSFTDVRTFINGSNIDTANLATSAKPVTVLGQFRMVAEASHWLGSASNSGTYVPSLTQSIRSGNSHVSSEVPVLVTLTAADYSVSGLTTRLRLDSVTVTTSTGPGVSLTYGLYPVTVAGGATVMTVATGTIVSGSSIAVSGPSANVVQTHASSDFAAPSDGVYALCVTTPGTTSGAFAVQLRLSVHHV